MRRFAGCCRFTWNKALALEKETYEQGSKRHGSVAVDACTPLRGYRHGLRPIYAVFICRRAKLVNS